jgi:hypothetical protein
VIPTAHRGAGLIRPWGGRLADAVVLVATVTVLVPLYFVLLLPGGLFVLAATRIAKAVRAGVGLREVGLR